jgi:hypothetical protein
MGFSGDDQRSVAVDEGRANEAREFFDEGTIFLIKLNGMVWMRKRERRRGRTGIPR